MDTGVWSSVGIVWRWQNVWVTLAVSLIIITPTADAQEYIAKGCPGGKEDSPPVEVTLTCPEGQVISLGEAKFGRNKYTHCTITDGDCLDNTDAFSVCEGRHNCTVHFDRPLSPSCGYATFITVTYDCQTVTSTSPLPEQAPTSPHYTSSTAKVPIITTTTTTTTTTDGTGQTHSEEDNTALIVGCVVAVTVTVVLLIIAIVLVVRRLACSTDLSEDEEKKSTTCHIFPCMRADPNSSGPKPRQDETDSQGEDAKRSKRKRKHRSRWADKNQNMSPRLAPVGQEDEEDSSASQSRTAGAAATSASSARASVYSEAGGASSARSSLAMDTSGQLKRHSSGARSAHSDIVRQQHEGGGGGGGEEVSELDDFRRRGGEGKGSRRGVQTQGRSSTGSGKMTGFSAPNQDRAPPGRGLKPSSDKQAAKTPKQRNQFDAVAVPNTETFTSC